jgi:hypothetical protein
MSIEATFAITSSDDLTSIRHDWLNDDDVEMGTWFHCETRHLAWVAEQLALFLGEPTWGEAELSDGNDALKARLGGDFDRGDPWLLLENRRPRELPKGGFSTLRLDVSMARQLAGLL